MIHTHILDRGKRGLETDGCSPIIVWPQGRSDWTVTSARDIAAQHGKQKQIVFKILKRLGIETTKQRSTTGKNQLTGRRGRRGR